MTDLTNTLSAWTRPISWSLLLLLGGVTVWGVMHTVQTVQAQPGRFTWRMSARALGVLLAAASAFLTISLLLLTKADPSFIRFTELTPSQVVPLVVPLLGGIQAALLISLEDEPLLELSLSYPRPFAWLVAERLGVMFALQICIGLLGTLLGLSLSGEGNLLAGMVSASVRWLPPLIFLVGLGVRVTLSTRQNVFGAVLVIPAWFVMRFFGDVMLINWPFVWPLHLYLRPETLSGADYLLNRALVTLLGIGLTISGVNEVRNEEHVLTGASSTPFNLRRLRKVEPS